jgi:hypothetical protein
MMISSNILDKIDNQVAGFPSRPDWDGYITDAEARNWWKNGNGERLFVFLSKINLHPVTTKDFKNNSTITHNFFLDFTSDKDVGRVYGTLTLNLVNPNTGEVKIGARSTTFIDDYHFNRHENGSLFRNITTWGARQIIGEGTPFNIYGYGNNPRVRVKW